MRWLVFVFFGCFSLVLSAKSFDERLLKHEVALGGSVFDTWGLGYEQRFSDSWAWRTSFLGYFRSSYNWYGRLANTIGLSRDISVHDASVGALKDSVFRVYGVGYLANIYEYSKSAKYGSYGDKDTKEGSHTLRTGIGVGPGVDYRPTRYLSFSLEMPWMFFWRSSFHDGGRSFSFDNAHPHIGGMVAYCF